MPTSELLASGPGTGKTRYCVELFRHQLSASRSGIDSRSFFVLPSREHAERIQNLVITKETPGFFNAHILTINDLAARFLSESPSRTPTDAVRRTILQNIWKEGAFPYLEAVKDCEGALDLWVDTLREFNTSLLGITEFETRAQGLLKDPAFRIKFKDFSLIAKRYEKELRRLGLAEPEEDIVRLLSQELPAGKSIDLLVLDGFYHFTNAQLELVRALSAISRHSVVTLTLPSNASLRPHAFEYPLDTRKRLLKIGFKPVKASGFQIDHRSGGQVLKDLQTQLFMDKAPAASQGPVDGVVILEAQDPRLEVEQVAQEIMRLYQERGDDLHFSDICIICRQVGVYEEILETVFEHYRIPVHVHERKKLIEHGFSRLMGQYLALVLEDWRREDLLTILKSSYLSGRIDPGEIVQFERVAFGENIAHGKTQWQELLLRSDMPASIAQVIRELLAVEEGLMASANAQVFGERWMRWADDWLELGPAGPFARTKEEWVDHKVRQVCQMLFDKAHEYHAERTQAFDPRGFMRELEHAFSAALFSDRPRGRNFVQVYDVILALPKEYKVVFVMGLSEKRFPVQVLEDPVFKDDERRLMNVGGPVLEERQKRRSGEKYFFYMAVTRASQKLYLCFSLSDADGRPSSRSFYLDEVERCFPGQRIPRHTRGASDCLITPSEWLSGAVGTVSFGRAAVLKGQQAIEHFKSFQGPYSPTRLEVYATCAFKYFTDKVMKLEEPFKAREHIVAGNVLHETLQRFFEHSAKDLAALKQSLKEPHGLRQMLERVLTESDAAREMRSMPLYRQKVWLKQLSRVIDQFVARENELVEGRGLVPSYFEWEFKMDLGVPMTGKIDRIDLSPDGKKALVVDYKLSKRAVSIEEKLAGGIELQLPVYILAVAQKLGVRVMGAELRVLKQGNNEGIYRESEKETLDLGSRKRKGIYADEDFDKLLEETRAHITGLVTRLRSADIRVDPKSCDHCSFNAVCRFETRQLAYTRATEAIES